MKKGILKKAPALLICIVLTLFSTSCGEEKDREYDELEVVSAAADLIKGTELLNEIYYGTGIRYNPVGNQTYQQADELWLMSKGFSTVEELKKMTRKVYTTDYCNIIFASAFESAKDAYGNVESFARYIQMYDESSEANPEPTYILVNTSVKPLFEDTVEYAYETLRVTRVKGRKVYVSIEATVTSSDGKSQTREIEVALIEEADGWRLDEPTYLKYNAALDVPD